MTVIQATSIPVAAVWSNEEAPAILSDAIAVKKEHYQVDCSIKESVRSKKASELRTR